MARKRRLGTTVVEWDFSVHDSLLNVGMRRFHQPRVPTWVPFPDSTTTTKEYKVTVEYSPFLLASLGQLGKILVGHVSQKLAAVFIRL